MQLLPDDAHILFFRCGVKEGCLGRVQFGELDFKRVYCDLTCVGDFLGLGELFLKEGTLVSESGDLGFLGGDGLAGASLQRGMSVL
jgi:hypothetical protein